MASMYEESKNKSASDQSNITCPSCFNKEFNCITDFGTKGLCGQCRKTWFVLDKFQ